MLLHIKYYKDHNAHRERRLAEVIYYFLEGGRNDFGSGGLVGQRHNCVPYRKQYRGE